MRASLLAAAAFVALAGGILHAQFPRLRLETVAAGQIVSPVAAAHAGDGSGRLFIADQRGKIHVLDADGMVRPTPFLDLEAKLVTERNGFDERGLLGLAFHPEYGVEGAAGEGRFYVYYSAPSPNAPGTAEDPVDHRSVVAEFRVSVADPDLADPDSERMLLTLDQPQFNHNAGQLAFGPDGLLHVATGDGGSSRDNAPGHTGGSSDRPLDALGNAQDLTRLLGKILRIDVHGSDGETGEYGIPPDNPFVDGAAGERPEIYLYGLRNPWRFSFDDGEGGTNRLFIADVGQGLFEEVNVVSTGPGGDAGGNLGWRIKEGTRPYSDSSLPDPGNLIDPVVEYAHPGADVEGVPEIGLSITGGFVYRGSAIPDLVGKYVFADWSTDFGSPNGTLLGMEEDGGGGWTLHTLDLVGGNPIPYFLTSFGVDEDGELYLLGKKTAAAGATDPDTGLPTGVVFRLHSAEPVETVLEPVRDNSIYEEVPNNSAGAEVRLFAGTTDALDARRALLRFDLEALLPGSIVQSAALSLRVTKTPSPPMGSGMFRAHRLTRDWGEAGSDGFGNNTGRGVPAEPGDATWRAAFHSDDLWTSLGGDFVATSSASGDAGTSLGRFSLVTTEADESSLEADVQAWIDDPASNHGWIVVGADEAKSARQFGSREDAQSNRPQLTIAAVPPIAQDTYRIWRERFFPPGAFVDPSADLDGDLMPSLIEYTGNLDPLTADPDDARPGGTLDVAGSAFRYHFRFDPRAEDLICQIQASDSLDAASWQTIAEFGASREPIGPATVTFEPVEGADPVVLAVIEETLDLSQVERRFYRLVVTRRPPGEILEAATGWTPEPLVFEEPLKTSDHIVPGLELAAGRYAVGILYDHTRYPDYGGVFLNVDYGDIDPTFDDNYPLSRRQISKRNLSSLYDRFAEDGVVLTIPEDDVQDLAVSLETAGGGLVASGDRIQGLIIRKNDPISGCVEDQGAGLYCHPSAIRHSNGRLYRLHVEMYTGAVFISDGEGRSRRLGTYLPFAENYNDRYHTGIALVELADGALGAFWCGHFDPYLWVTRVEADLSHHRPPVNVAGPTARLTYIHAVRTSDERIHVFCRGSDDGLSQKGAVRYVISGLGEPSTSPVLASVDQIMKGALPGATKNLYIDSVRLHSHPVSGRELIVVIWNPLLNDRWQFGTLGAVLDPAAEGGNGVWFDPAGFPSAVTPFGTTNSPRFSDADIAASRLTLFPGNVGDHYYRAAQAPGHLTRIDDWDTPRFSCFGVLAAVPGASDLAHTMESAAFLSYRWTPGLGMEIVPFVADEEQSAYTIPSSSTTGTAQEPVPFLSHEVAGHYWSAGAMAQLEDGNGFFALAAYPVDRQYVDRRNAIVNPYYEQGGTMVRMWRILSPFGERPVFAYEGSHSPPGGFTVTNVSYVPDPTDRDIVTLDLQIAVNELYPVHRQCVRETLRVGRIGSP